MIVLKNGYVCLLATNITLETNYYFYFKIVISINNKFNCIINNHEINGVSAVIINKNIKHSIFAHECNLLIYYLEIESPYANAIKYQLHQKEWIDISNEISIRLSNKGTFIDQLSTTEDTIDEILKNITHHISDSQYHKKQIDSRILRIIEYIDKNIHKELSLKQLATIIFLSPERTRHLFEEQTGIPLSQYILWKRVKLSIISSLVNKVSLGEIAIQNGFSDQSHFNKIFKRMFGTTPRTMLKKILSKDVSSN